MTHVLIAEDEPQIAAFMQKGLNRAGYQTEIAHDGLTALDALNQSNFQLVLLDLGLPAMDGETVLQTLRSQGKTCPVLIVSARLPEPPDTSPIENLANGWIHKPFKMQELLKQIHELLGRAIH